MQEWATTNNISLPSRERTNAAHVFKHEAQVDDEDTPNNILQVSGIDFRPDLSFNEAFCLKILGLAIANSSWASLWQGYGWNVMN